MAEWKMKDFDLTGQLGKELLLVEVAPKAKYERNEATGKNERTDEIDGYTYEILMKEKKYKSIRVTVPNEPQIISQKNLDKKGEVFVELAELTCTPYSSNGFIALSFKASRISLKA